MSRARRGDRNLIQGEDPLTTSAQDARHWIGIYGQMIDFKLRLLAEVGRGLEGIPPVAREELGTDIKIIEEQLERYRVRLNFWYARHFKLQGIVLDEATRIISHQGAAVQLTARELQLLQALMRRPGVYLTARQLVADAWHDSALSDDELRLYVSSLRKKLKQINLARVVNRPSRGYTLAYT